MSRTLLYILLGFAAISAFEIAAALVYLGVRIRRRVREIQRRAREKRLEMEELEKLEEEVEAEAPVEEEEAADETDEEAAKDQSEETADARTLSAPAEEESIQWPDEAPQMVNPLIGSYLSNVREGEAGDVEINPVMQYMINSEKQRTQGIQVLPAYLLTSFGPTVFSYHPAGLPASSQLDLLIVTQSGHN